jgi:D-arabinose 1-dehydrogenase-like Zn-dependent alcohol dehydrogenase
VGVDHVLEIGGQYTIEKAADALGFGGHMALIGGLTGSAPGVPLFPLLIKRGTASGIYVGSRDEFEAMLEFMTKHELRPIIDREFSFDQAQEAYDFMENGSYMGKIVIAY